MMPRIIQIEVTAACQASCAFCPRPLLKSDWIVQHLSWENFNQVLTAVGRNTLVHLQGWGEPLLHPRLWDMAKAVRSKKGRVSLTTNGMLLDKEVSDEITRIGFEFVAVTLADADAARHGELRAGTALDRISENIRYLRGLKNRPHIHIPVQMMKSNLERLPQLVELAAGLGVDRVIASNLDCIVCPEVDSMKAFNEEPEPHIEEIVATARRRGRELNIEVEIYPLYLRDNIAVCAADPLHTVVVTAKGEVAPCVYLSLPLKGDIPRIYRGEMEMVPHYIYGNLTNGFKGAMKSNMALSFLQAFHQRSQAAMLGTAGQLAMLAMPRVRSTQGAFLEPAARLISPSGISALPSAPQPCRHCYKLYGI